MKGYHVSAQRNRVSILRQGLRRDGGGWDAGHIWFFVDRDIALTLATQWRQGRGGNDVWQIDLDGLELAGDPHPGWSEERRPGWNRASRVVDVNIEPARLELIR